MRIAVFHNHPPGGAARAIHELGRQLSGRHAIDVYTLSTGDEEFLPSSDYARSVHVFPYRPRPPLRFGLYLNEIRRYRDLDALERVSERAAATIDAAAYDAVLVSACRVLQAPAVLFHLRTPTAYYCHEPPRRFLQPDCRPDAGPLGAYARLRARWHRPAEALLERRLAGWDRRNVAAADTVLTNSAFTAGLVERYYRRRAQVCALGVDAARLRPNGRPAGGYVLSVGAVEHHKGFDLLVEALALVPAALRPRLLIAGNWVNPGVAGHLRTLAQGRAVDLTIRSGVSDDELAAIYGGARAFVYAPRQEPFGLAVLEAMACGLPVVAVAEGGVPESVADGVSGLVVERDARAFAAALMRILEDGRLAAALGQQGRRLAETRWTWESAGRRLEEALASLAMDGGAP